MREGEQTFIEISGYIDYNFNLSGTISGRDLENKKIGHNLYKLLLEDLMYRLEMYEYGDDGINFDDVEWKPTSANPTEEKYTEFVINTLMKLIEAKSLPIKEVDFTEYEDDDMRGYDYVATLNLTFEQFLEEE